MNLFNLKPLLGNLVLLLYFILTTRYVRISQRHIVGKLKQALRKTCSNKENLNFNSHLLNYRALEWSRRHHNELVSGISGYNNFWSYYLTVYFTVYTIEIVYLVYSYFFVPTVLSPLQKAFFLAFSFDFFIILMLVTGECSVVIGQNREIAAAQRSFGMELLQLERQWSNGIQLNQRRQSVISQARNGRFSLQSLLKVRQ